MNTCEKNVVEKTRVCARVCVFVCVGVRGCVRCVRCVCVCLLVCVCVFECVCYLCFFIFQICRIEIFSSLIADVSKVE